MGAESLHEKHALQRLSHVIQPRNYLRACLLLLLCEDPAYGYELRDRLRCFADRVWEPGSVYRALHALEREALITSRWEYSSSGPIRRRYEVTGRGRSVLDSEADDLQELLTSLSSFLERFGRPRADREEACGAPGLTGEVTRSAGAS